MRTSELALYCSAIRLRHTTSVNFVLPSREERNSYPDKLHRSYLLQFFRNIIIRQTKCTLSTALTRRKSQRFCKLSHLSKAAPHSQTLPLIRKIKSTSFDMRNINQRFMSISANDFNINTLSVSMRFVIFRFIGKDLAHVPSAMG